MPDEKLIDYIKKLLNQGHNRDQIHGALLKSGWEEDQINESFDSIEREDLGISRFPVSFVKIKKSFFIQNKKLIFPILGVIFIGGFVFASWQIWGPPKEMTKSPEQQEQELLSEILEEEFSFQNSDVVAFPAADGQFPMPEYEKMAILEIGDFYRSGGEQQVEFSLLYMVGGNRENDIRSFYVEALGAEGWNIEEDLKTGLYEGDRTESIVLSFSKPESELYEIRILIRESESRNPLREGWPMELTWVEISHRWPFGFDYAKDLTPNSPFCKYFDRDFKKIISSITGEGINLNGLYEVAEDPDWGVMRSFFYVSEKKISLDDIAKIKEAFVSSGYKIIWEDEDWEGHFSFVEQVTEVNFMFGIKIGEEGLIIEFFWNLIWDKNNLREFIENSDL